MGKPSPAAKVVEFRYVAAAKTAQRVRSHVRVHPRATTDIISALEPPLFDWARDPDLDQQPPVRALGPVLPTLVACALDRVGQHLDDPTRVSKADAFEALRLIRAHFRPEVI